VAREQFAWEDIAKRTLELYKRLLGHNDHR
jgi:hypothetical protein